MIRTLMAALVAGLMALGGAGGAMAATKGKGVQLLPTKKPTAQTLASSKTTKGKGATVAKSGSPPSTITVKPPPTSQVAQLTITPLSAPPPRPVSRR